MVTGHLWYNPSMVLSASEFKAKCLELLDRVFETGERIQVTKRGRVVAELGPVSPDPGSPAKAGFAREQIAICGDVVAPSDEEWEALK